MQCFDLTESSSSMRIEIFQLSAFACRAQILCQQEEGEEVENSNELLNLHNFSLSRLKISSTIASLA